MSEKIKIVNTDNLNFRNGPSTDYKIIQSLPKNTQVEIVMQLNEWTLVRYKDTLGFVYSKYLNDKITEISKINTSISADKIIQYAKSLLGKKYVWADEGPNTFDCSGFTWYVYKNIAKISLPRSSKEQGAYGTYINKENLQPADLVFFDTVGAKDNVISHVGIYMGNNQFIHASSGQGKVVISQLDSNYYSKAFVNGRRVLKQFQPPNKWAVF